MIWIVQQKLLVIDSPVPSRLRLTFGLSMDTGRLMVSAFLLLTAVEATEGAMEGAMEIRRALLPPGRPLTDPFLVFTLPKLAWEAESEKSSCSSSAEPNNAFHLQRKRHGPHARETGGVGLWVLRCIPVLCALQSSRYFGRGWAGGEEKGEDYDGPSFTNGTGKRHLFMIGLGAYFRDTWIEKYTDKRHLSKYHDEKH